MSAPQDSGTFQAKKFFLPVLALLGIILAVLFALKAQQGRGPHGSEDFSEIKVGSTLPDLTLHPFELGSSGKNIQLSALPGKVFLINFWATWCEACTAEMPSIVKLLSLYKGQGLTVVAINLDERPDAVVPNAVKTFGLSFPIYLDVEEQAVRTFDVHALPMSAVLNKARTVLHMETGEKNWMADDIRNEIEKWLKN